MSGVVRRLLPLVRDSEDGDEQAPVLDAALGAFEDFGIRRTSMGEVAKRSRLSPATLYRRFAQKSDLVQAVMLREARRVLARMDAQVDRTSPPAEQIARMYVVFVDAIAGHRLLRRLTAVEPEIVLPRLTVDGAPLLELGRDYLVEFIRRLQDSGDLPAYDPVPVAELVVRIGHSLMLTPQTSIPTADDVAARAFARTHIAPLFGLSHDIRPR